MQKLLKTVWGLEDLWDLAVQFADDLVDGLFPRWVHIFAGHNGIEELPQCNLGHFQEAIGDLQGQKEEGNICIQPLEQFQLCFLS